MPKKPFTLTKLSFKTPSWAIEPKKGYSMKIAKFAGIWVVQVKKK